MTTGRNALIDRVGEAAMGRAMRGWLMKTDGSEPGSKRRQDRDQDSDGNGVPPAKSNSSIHTLVIIGQIEGHLVLPAQNKTTKYEHVIPQLVAIEENKEVRGLLLVLNTVGGDVEAGLALSEMIASLSKPTVSLVLGGGHSIGGPIAVAADYSYIAPTATMTIHPIRMNGLVIGVPQTYEYLDKMQDRVVKFVTQHSHVTEDKYRELMFRTGELARDIGTVMVGRDAVDIGLIDGVGGIGQSLAKLKALIKERRPAPRQRDPRSDAPPTPERKEKG